MRHLEVKITAIYCIFLNFIKKYIFRNVTQTFLSVPPEDRQECLCYVFQFNKFLSNNRVGEEGMRDWSR